MTQRDKWLTGTKKRAPVRRYHDFVQLCYIYNVELFECDFEVVFILAMPKSWSKKKRAAMIGQPHQQTPDNDNLMKALKDAVYQQDSHIWDYRISKIWGEKSLIVISKIDHARGSLRDELSKKLKVDYVSNFSRLIIARKRLLKGSLN